MIAQRLRAETATRHRRIEARLPPMSPALSLDDYRSLLGSFFGYYAPLEARLEPWAGALSSGQFRLRPKSPWLAQDLSALGVEPAALPLCARLPALESFPSVLGCLYVVEGATLGGQIICKQLGAGLGLTPDAGAAFFAAYGADTPQRWREFGAFLVASAERTGADAEIVASANETFDTLFDWLYPTEDTK